MLMQTGINQKAMGQGQFQGFAGQNQAMHQKIMQVSRSMCRSVSFKLIRLPGRYAEWDDESERHEQSRLSNNAANVRSSLYGHHANG